MPRKFRKVYFVVKDNSIFGQHNHFSVETYYDKETADRICALRKEEAIRESRMHYMKNKPIPEFKVHAFYLVHESLF